MHDALTFQVSVRCPRCHQPVHVQGLRDTAWCGSCAAEVPLPWSDWLGPAHLAGALELPEGERISFESLSGLQPKLAYGREAPSCPGCGRPLAQDALLAALPSGGLACGCGAWVSVRAPDPLVAALAPAPVVVVGEGPVTLDDAPVAEPIALRCDGCGGALDVDGRLRTVPCGYCGATTWLPDALWLRLHPPRTVRRFSVLVEAADASGCRPPERLARLAQHFDPALRRSVAADPSAPVERLETLSRDERVEVREAVARNPHVPGAVLASLAADPSLEVRVAVARHPATPADALGPLSRDPEPPVRRAVLDNPSAPPERVLHLARAGNATTRAAACADPRVTAELLVPSAAEETEPSVLDALLGRPDVTPTLLAVLARNPSPEARRRAARHPATPLEVLGALAADDDGEVRRTLAGRDELPDELAVSLARAGAASFDTPTLLRLLGRPHLPAEALRVASRHADPRVAKRAAEHPDFAAVRRSSRRRIALGALGLGLAIGALAAVGGVVALGLALLRLSS